MHVVAHLVVSAVESTSTTFPLLSTPRPPKAKPCDGMYINHLPSSRLLASHAPAFAQSIRTAAAPKVSGDGKYMHLPVAAWMSCAV